MCSRVVVIVEIFAKDSAKMICVEDDTMVKAFAANRTYYSFAVWILPGGFRRDDDLLDAEPFDALDEIIAIDTVSIAEQESGRGVVWKSLDDLSCGPKRVWICGDVEMQDLSSVVGEDEKDEEYFESDGRNCEEIDGHDVLCVIGEESSPCLRWWLSVFDHVFEDGIIVDHITKQGKLTLNMRRAPQRILFRQLANERDDLGIDNRPTALSSAFQTPIVFEPFSVPYDHGLRPDDIERAAPFVPNIREQDPEGTIHGIRLDPFDVVSSPEHNDLMSQGQVLERELLLVFERGASSVDDRSNDIATC